MLKTRNKVARLFFVGGKTRNSHIRLVLQQCCTFLLLLSVSLHLKTVNRLSICKGSGRAQLARGVFFFFLYPKTLQMFEKFDNLIKLYQVMFEGYR